MGMKRLETCFRMMSIATVSRMVLKGTEKRGQEVSYCCWDSPGARSWKSVRSPQVDAESQEGEERAPELCPYPRRPATDRRHEQPYALGASNRP